MDADAKICTKRGRMISSKELDEPIIYHDIHSIKYTKIKGGDELPRNKVMDSKM